MKIEKALGPDAGARIIRRYGTGYVVVNEDTITTSMILTPTELDTDWPPETFAQLDFAHCEALLSYGPDLVLLGTGRRQQFPAAEIMARVMQAGIGIEVMDTAAACRTFNILMNEGRKVVAGLLMIEE